MPEIIKDEKEHASIVFGQVANDTRNNFPEAEYRPRVSTDGAHLFLGKHSLASGSDGTGTKPELGERLMDLYGDPTVIETVAFDLVAMIIDDAARKGHFAIAMENVLDVNTAKDKGFIEALARGLKRACDKGHLALMDGEVAELGYRVPGYGKNHLNWNASVKALRNKDKLIDGSKLKPGQDVIGIQETSVRSNGLTDVRKILEHAFLMREMGSASKRDYLIRETRSDLQGQFSAADIGMILDAYTRRFPVEDYSHVPWHTMFPELTKKLLTPSTLYSPLIYNAQGGVDGEVRIPLVACAHVSGGGIPLKGKRMLESKGLGMNLEQKFQNPHGITELLQLAEQYPVNGEPIVTNTSASRKWNMGVGFLCVVESQAHGEELIKMALEMGYPGAAFLGKTTDKQIIHWRGEDWTYNRAESLKA